jgi:hypothetical protein
MRRNVPGARDQRMSLIVTKIDGKGMNSKVALNLGGIVRELMRA